MNPKIFKLSCSLLLSLVCLLLIVWLYVRPEPASAWLYALLVIVLIGALDELGIA